MAQRNSTNITLLKIRLQSAYGTARGPTEICDLDMVIPDEYSDFLSEIGGGTIGQMFFELYDKPLSSNHIYGSNAPDHLKNLIFVGDDYNGFCVGLDPNNKWAVVEVDKHSLETKVLAETFFDFLMNDWRLDPSSEEL